MHHRNIITLAKGNTCNNPSLPGTVGTPAFFIVSLAVDLSPMTLMLSGCKFRNHNLHSIKVIINYRHNIEISKMMNHFPNGPVTILSGKENIAFAQLRLV